VLPLPDNKVKYVPSEVARILAEVSNTKQAIETMIKLKLTDLKMSQLYAIKKRYYDGRVMNDAGGRPPVITVPRLDKLTAAATNGANTIGKEEMLATLMSAVEQRRIDTGLSTVGCGVSAKTVQRYMGVAASAEAARSTSSAIHKTTARFAAERSLRSAMTHTLVTAVAHFIPTDGEGSQSDMAKMVSAASGDVSVTTVSPFMLWSMDGTTIVASVGKSGHTELRVASAAETGKTHAVFSSSTGGATALMNAAGMVAPLCVTGRDCGRGPVLHEWESAVGAAPRPAVAFKCLLQTARVLGSAGEPEPDRRRPRARRLLLQLLFQRLKNHKAARVMEVPKRQSRVFDWVEEKALSERQPALLQSSDRPCVGLYGTQKWPLTAPVLFVRTSKPRELASMPRASHAARISTRCAGAE